MASNYLKVQTVFDIGISLSDIVIRLTRSRKRFGDVDQHFVVTTLGQPAADHVIIYIYIGIANLGIETLLRSSATLCVGVYMRRACTTTQMKIISSICRKEIPPW